MTTFRVVLTFFWLGLGIWRLIDGDTTNMLICYAISAIWAATSK